MKTYSKNQNGWSAKDNSLLNETDLEQLRDTKLTAEQRNNLTDSINKQSAVELTAQQIADLEAFYENKKPELRDGDDYQLIAIDLREAGDTYSGILNCRVNGEHIQIRFS
jgi:hypothetical protein